MKALFLGASMLGASLALTGCGGQQDRFAPGDWELQSWMEVEGRSGQFEQHTIRTRLSPQRADKGVQAAMFSEFYNVVKSGEVVFEDGVISGHIDQPAVAPFPAHKQPVSGTYSADAFEMRLTMPPIGAVQSYQFVSGRLVKAD